MGWRLSMETGSTWALRAMLEIPAPALWGAAFPRISCRRWRMGEGASVAEADGDSFFISYLKTANSCTTTFASSSILGNVLMLSSSSLSAYGGRGLVQYPGEAYRAMTSLSGSGLLYQERVQNSKRGETAQWSVAGFFISRWLVRACGCRTVR